jgi:hypothetical protein
MICYRRRKCYPLANISRILAVLIISAIGLTACLPSETPPLIIQESPTITISPTPTATVDWFPSTATPTNVPTQRISPTPDLRPNLGDVILQDDFSEEDSWTLGRTSSGSAALGLNELTIAIAAPRAYEFSVRQTPILGDFYAEITATPTLCRGEDEYGLLIRMASPADFYRYSLSCDGKVRLDRIVGGTASSPQPWMVSGSVPAGAPSVSRLGVWAVGKEMRFFINEHHQFTIEDPLLPGGNIGVFARSAGDTAVTVNFSDLIIRQINQ